MHPKKLEYSKFILYILKHSGILSRKELIKKTLMPTRTVGFALKKLLKKKIIHKVNPREAEKRRFQDNYASERYDQRATFFELNWRLPLGITPRY